MELRVYMIATPVESAKEEITPPVPRLSDFTQMLSAAPSGPQVSGTVIQAADRLPRSTH